ncbi:MAG TPA: hypothetical protein VEV41_18145 [Terriglobales bacterium]|nr:hypothetical protein [Terriglobales bacterium]
MATWVQPSESSHWRKLSSSRVVVPNVLICLRIFPLGKTYPQAGHDGGLMHVQPIRSAQRTPTLSTAGPKMFLLSESPARTQRN